MKYDLSLSRPLNADFYTNIWSIIEAKREFPGVLAITAADGRDDTGAVARGLATASAAAGRRTGYLGLIGDSAAQMNLHQEYDELSLPSTEFQRSALDKALSSWREDYGVVIIDVGELRTNAVGAHIARIADGVVVGVFANRKVTEADHALKTLLSQLGAPIIGVLKTCERTEIAARRSAVRNALLSRLFPARQQ